jgi:hypothetical protein
MVRFYRPRPESGKRAETRERRLVALIADSNAGRKVRAVSAA